jgi:hypothetical protein
MEIHCKSWLASDGGRETGAKFERAIAGKLAPTE